MYRMIAVDIDGTLLNSQGRITEKTVDVVRRVRERGVHFVLCTGRPVQGILDIYRYLSLDSPLIAYNGGMVLLRPDDRPIFEKALTQDDTRSIIALSNQYDVTAVIWHESRLYVTKMNEKAAEYGSLSRVEPLLLENDGIFSANGATKILFTGEVPRIREIEGALKPLIGPSVNMHTSQPYFLEFVHADVSKSIAMEILGNHLDIPRKEMMALGDGFNDLSMIEYAGLGVAMGNAPDEVRKKAGFVTLSCDEDGLAYAIEKFILAPL
ncbi:MAG: Cof-type HAD-IIB family hydrolase [Clostridia bacterium]